MSIFNILQLVSDRFKSRVVHKVFEFFTLFRRAMFVLFCVCRLFY